MTAEPNLRAQGQTATAAFGRPTRAEHARTPESQGPVWPVTPAINRSPDPAHPPSRQDAPPPGAGPALPPRPAPAREFPAFLRVMLQFRGAPGGARSRENRAFFFFFGRGGVALGAGRGERRGGHPRGIPGTGTVSAADAVVVPFSALVCGFVIRVRVRRELSRGSADPAIAGSAPRGPHGLPGIGTVCWRLNGFLWRECIFPSLVVS